MDLMEPKVEVKKRKKAWKGKQERWNYGTIELSGYQQKESWRLEFGRK
jgi:hypothetical protein